MFSSARADHSRTFGSGYSSVCRSAPSAGFAMRMPRDHAHSTRTPTSPVSSHFSSGAYDFAVPHLDRALAAAAWTTGSFSVSSTERIASSARVSSMSSSARSMAFRALPEEAGSAATIAGVDFLPMLISARVAAFTTLSFGSESAPTSTGIDSGFLISPRAQAATYRRGRSLRRNSVSFGTAVFARSSPRSPAAVSTIRGFGSSRASISGGTALFPRVVTNRTRRSLSSVSKYGRSARIAAGSPPFAASTAAWAAGESGVPGNAVWRVSGGGAATLRPPPAQAHRKRANAPARITPTLRALVIGPPASNFRRPIKSPAARSSRSGAGRLFPLASYSSSRILYADPAVTFFLTTLIPLGKSISISYRYLASAPKWTSSGGQEQNPLEASTSRNPTSLPSR